MDKQQIRQRIWKEMDVWQNAKAIKCNPDSPQKFVRQKALQEEKTIYMAVPRLRKEKCFIELKGRMLANVASSIKGAFRYGKPVYPWEMKKIDLIVAGSVAVNRKGARVGKGGGYSDIEYAIAREVGIVDETTPVITTVHDIQVIDDEIPMKEHDVPVDYIITPTKIIETEKIYEKPKGIIWDILDKELPILEIIKQGKG